MSYFIRLKRRSRLPAEFEDTEAIFADANGVLKHMDPDGNVSNLAGAGSLPDVGEEGDVLTVVDGTWTPEAPSGGSQPGTVVIRKSAVFAFGDLGYSSGSGFAIFDSGISLAEGEELLSVYTHNAEEFTSATGTGEDFTFGAYSDESASDQLGGYSPAGQGTADGVTPEASYHEDTSVSPPITPILNGTTILADCNIFMYLTGPNEALTGGSVQVVAIVATALA